MSPVATSDSEIQSLTRDLHTGRCVVEVGTRTVALAAALWLALRGPWYTAPVAFLAIGILHYHFLVLSHEAQHMLIARSPRLNDWLGKWVFAYPFGQAFLSKRARHMKHVITPSSPPTLTSFRAPCWRRHIPAPVGFAHHAEHDHHPSAPHYLLDRITEHCRTSTSAMEVHRSHFEIVQICRADAGRE